MTTKNQGGQAIVFLFRTRKNQIEITPQQKASITIQSNKANQDEDKDMENNLKDLENDKG